MTLAYCLMSNHYHLLLHCPGGSLSEGMQRLVSLFTRHVNDRVGRDGALFRGRFHSREITDDSYLLAATRYIHRNPLDLPGVADIANYRWSSHRTYLGLRAEPSWLRTTDVLDHWKGDRQQFDEFVRDDLAAGVRPSVERADIEAVMAAAAIVFAERAEDASGRLARTVALTWASEQAADRALLQSLFEFDNRQALTAAISRGRRRLETDEEMREILTRAVSLSALGVSRLGSDPGVMIRGRRGRRRSRVLGRSRGRARCTSRCRRGRRRPLHGRARRRAGRR